jgi:hypothetical protein
VTVLFADLKGSMELLADRDPEYARRVLDPVLENEGTVNQVITFRRASSPANRRSVVIQICVTVIDRDVLAVHLPLIAQRLSKLSTARIEIGEAAGPGSRRPTCAVLPNGGYASPAIMTMRTHRDGVRQHARTVLRESNRMVRVCPRDGCLAALATAATSPNR